MQKFSSSSPFAPLWNARVHALWGQCSKPGTPASAFRCGLLVNFTHWRGRSKSYDPNSVENGAGSSSRKSENKQDYDAIADQKTEITEFDDALVKKLIEKVTVFADHFTVEFKSGIQSKLKHKKAPRH